MKDFIDQLKSDMKRQIDAIVPNQNNIIEVINLKIGIVAEAIKKLKSFTISYKFKNKEEEIDFFKKDKPFFYGDLLYYKNLQELEINAPFGKEEMKLFFERELQRANSFLELKKQWLIYYRTSATHLDEKYFLRSTGDNTSIEFEHSLIADTRFYTIGSINFSFIRATEMFIKEIEKRQGILNGTIVQEANESQYAIKKLKWKGPKVGLIELARAFKEVGALEEPLQEIYECFEQTFSVELDNPSRTFQEIISRKKEGAVYLNKLTLGLTNLIERMNSSYKPKK